MTISRLLYLGFGTLVILFVLGGLITHWLIGNISSAQAQIVDVATPLQEAFLEMKNSTLETSRGVVILREDPRFRGHMARDGFRKGLREAL